MSPEAIRAEYEACRDPDGTMNLERYAAMARRLYGVDLDDARPASPPDLTAFWRTLEEAAVDPNEPDWEIANDRPLELRVIPR